MALPSWTLAAIFFAAFIHLAGFFVCDASLPDNVSDGPIQTLRNHLQFTGCTGDLPAWVDWALFLVGTLPILLILFEMIVPLAAGLLSNSIAGTVATIAGLAALLAVLGVLISTA